ncbi:hypothetical protein QL285_040251 [Trifolium repens]|nr:hypothetical protein QL285_040251 [Trifolium repens]
MFGCEEVCGSVLGFYSQVFSFFSEAAVDRGVLVWFSELRRCVRCDLVLGELVCFRSGVIGLFQGSGGDFVSYGVLFLRGMRWWQPARMVLVAGGDWRLFWGGGGWRLLATKEFCYSGGSSDCVSL